MQKKHTPKTVKVSNQPSLAAARQILDVTATEADHETARQLLTIYHNKETPPMIRHLIFQVFWDAAQFYAIKLPENFTSKWRPYWPLLVARLRADGYMPSCIRYTWQPTPEEETELDAADDEEKHLRGIFNLLHDDRLSANHYNNFADEFTEILESVHPLNNFEVFRVAWPLALDKLASKTEGGKQ